MSETQPRPNKIAQIKPQNTAYFGSTLKIICLIEFDAAGQKRLELPKKEVLKVSCFYPMYAQCYAYQLYYLGLTSFSGSYKVRMQEVLLANNTAC